MIFWGSWHEKLMLLVTHVSSAYQIELTHFRATELQLATHLTRQARQG